MSTSSPTVPVEGVRLRLRLIQPEDARYLFELRTNPNYNRHLSPVSGTSDDQRLWIERYKDREAAGEEYYLVIERRDTGEACGVVRIYDIDDDHFTWGSWILDHRKPPKAALESAVLSFGVGFDMLGKSRALIDVRRGNDRAISIYERLGMRRTGEDEINLYFEYSAEDYARDRSRYMTIIEGSEGR